MQKSKELLRRVNITTLEKVNDEECEVLEERWLSDECMEAILKFMQRNKQGHWSFSLVRTTRFYKNWFGIMSKNYTSTVLHIFHVLLD